MVGWASAVGGSTPTLNKELIDLARKIRKQRRCEFIVLE